MRLSHLDARYLSQARIHDFIVAVDHNKTITEYLRDFYFKKIQLLQSVVHFEVNITDVVCYLYYVVSISLLCEDDGKVIKSFAEISCLSLTAPSASALYRTRTEVRGTVSSPAVLATPVVHPRQVSRLLGGHTPGSPHHLPALQGLHPPEEGGEGPPHPREGLDHLPRQLQYCLLQLGSFGLKTGVREGWAGLS